RDKLVTGVQTCALPISHAALTDDGGAADALGAAIAAIAGRRPFADVEARLRGAAAELDEAARDVRAAGDAIEEDPERLAQVQSRSEERRGGEEWNGWWQ